MLARSLSRRRPRIPQELAAQEGLFPADKAVAFGAAESQIAARLYRSLRRPRGREIDLAIAACALAHGATLWTLNRADFEDVAGSRCVSASRLRRMAFSPDPFLNPATIACPSDRRSRSGPGGP